MAKSKLRSIRISEHMNILIEMQAGNNFTEKWENLVTRCVWELPEKERRLANLQALVDEKEKEIQRLRKIHQEITEMEFILGDAKRHIEDLQNYIEDNTN